MLQLWEAAVLPTCLVPIGQPHTRYSKLASELHIKERHVKKCESLNELVPAPCIMFPVDTFVGQFFKTIHDKKKK